MWFSSVIFCSFLVFSAYGCGPAKPNCQAPTFVHQNTTNTVAGNATMEFVDNTTARFTCRRVSPNHNVMFTIEYEHIHTPPKVNHPQQEIGTEIAVDGSLTYECDPERKMYIGSHGEDFINVVKKLRCSSFEKSHKQEFIKSELQNTNITVAL